MLLSTLAIMAVTMVREAWTDERLDDLKEHMDEGFREVRADVRNLQGEVGTVREELGELRAEIKALNRTLQIGFGLIGSFLGVLTILIGTQL
jgi:predicted nuclease with TOPRIM domain